MKFMKPTGIFYRLYIHGILYFYIFYLQSAENYVVMHINININKEAACNVCFDIHNINCLVIAPSKQSSVVGENKLIVM